MPSVPFNLLADVHQGVDGFHLLDLLSFFIKHDNLVDTKHDAGAGDLSGQVGPQLRGLSVIEDGPRQGHTDGVRAT